ncbi:MAG TPA: DUF5317 family protein [Candidatus Limnocylindrales bacterium]|jgi:hypothetical protein|nr:DUF5317 family protein [Candidatus Limnocylindrales bacterium]
MFLLYAVLAGLVAGLALGGRLRSLGAMRLRWAWLIVAGMAIQGLLYSEPIGERVAQLGPAVGPGLYIGSIVLVLAAVVRNIRIPGLALVAVGAAANLAAIVANGGYMPVSPEALGSHVPSGGYSNSVTAPDPALRFLTDIFALPDWLPAGNVFSVGDVFIGLGIATAIVVQMRRGAGMDRPVLIIDSWPRHGLPPTRPVGVRCGPATPPSGRPD